MNLIGLFAGLISLFGVVLGGYLAHKDSFLTVAQMQKKGFEHGLPWLAHGGMWGDLFLITPLIAILAARYHSAWDQRTGWYWLVACIAIGFIAAWFYDKTTFPEAHTYGHVRSATGWEHLFYLSFALWFIVMFYFSTPHALIPPGFAVMTSAVLVIHIFFGTHTALKIWNPSWFGIPFRATDLVPTAVVAAVLAWRTWDIVSVR